MFWFQRIGIIWRSYGFVTFWDLQIVRIIWTRHESIFYFPTSPNFDPFWGLGYRVLTMFWSFWTHHRIKKSDSLWSIVSWYSNHSWMVDHSALLFPEVLAVDKDHWKYQVRAKWFWSFCQFCQVCQVLLNPEYAQNHKNRALTFQSIQGS